MKNELKKGVNKFSIIMMFYINSNLHCQWQWLSVSKWHTLCN